MTFSSHEYLQRQIDQIAEILKLDLTVIVKTEKKPASIAVESIAMDDNNAGRQSKDDAVERSDTVLPDEHSHSGAASNQHPHQHHLRNQNNDTQLQHQLEEVTQQLEEVTKRLQKAEYRIGHLLRALEARD